LGLPGGIRSAKLLITLRTLRDPCSKTDHQRAEHRDARGDQEVISTLCQGFPGGRFRVTLRAARGSPRVSRGPPCVQGSSKGRFGDPKVPLENVWKDAVGNP
jgi:hypothetical protein